MKSDKLFDLIAWKNTYDPLHKTMGYDMQEVTKLLEDPEIVDPETDKVLISKSIFDALNRLCEVGVDCIDSKKTREGVLALGKKLGFNLITFTATLNESYFWQWPYLKDYTTELEQSPWYDENSAYGNKQRVFVTFADRWRFVKDGWVAHDHKYIHANYDGIEFFRMPYRGRNAGKDWGRVKCLHAGFFKSLEAAVNIETPK